MAPPLQGQRGTGKQSQIVQMCLNCYSEHPCMRACVYTYMGLRAANIHSTCKRFHIALREILVPAQMNSLATAIMPGSSVGRQPARASAAWPRRIFGPRPAAAQSTNLGTDMAQQCTNACVQIFGCFDGNSDSLSPGLAHSII